MNEQTTLCNVRVTHIICPCHHLDGEEDVVMSMVRGMALTNPAQYTYQCPVCQHTEYSVREYPMIEYVPVEEKTTVDHVLHGL